MTEDELSYYHFKLDNHTSKVKSAFARVVHDLQKDIEENSSLKVVINCLKAYDKLLVEKLSDCESIVDVFNKILDHVSFFDFKIIKILTRIGSRSTQKKYKKYTTMFKEYSKCRVVECPSDAFGDAENSEKVFVLKIDKNHQSLSVAELNTLCSEVTNILGHKRLLHVEEGCVQLTFRGFEDEELTVTKEQQQALRNAGVLSISYGEQVVDISRLFSIQSDTTASGE